MPIRVLPPDVAAKIAAGEVIERPVSVAKELLENALDAGADEIHVEVAQGGRRLIRVSDSGCGIPAAEVELAFARHATSKLTSAEELFRVRTLGFRGEALASIVAVSRLTLTTRSADEEVGSLVRLEGGQLLSREGLGRPPGTMVQVENLFYNTPARAKFLRSDPTEAGHIARLVSSYALAYAEKRLTLQNNERLVLRTPGTGALLETIVALYGLDVAEQLLALPEPPAEALVRIVGYVSAPSLHRADRQDLVFFVNRRWVQDNALAYAVTEAYRTLLPAGRYPLVVLNITLPPEEVDVNIHPTKREVRFRQSREVFAAVQKAVRILLMAQHPAPLVTPGLPISTWGQQQSFVPAQPRQADTGHRLLQPIGASSPSLPLTVPTRPHARLPMLRVLGQAGLTYIIAEGPGGLYLIDQHAAHERIRYEELQGQRAQAGVASQELLDPIPLELSPQQATLLEEHLSALSACGFEVIPFGGSSFLVKRIPAQLSMQEVQEALGEIVEKAQAGE